MNANEWNLFILGRLVFALVVGCLFPFLVAGYGRAPPLYRAPIPFQRKLSFLFHFMLLAFNQTCPSEDKAAIKVNWVGRSKRELEWLSGELFALALVATKHITHYAVIKEMKFLYEGGSKAGREEQPPLNQTKTNKFLFDCFRGLLRKELKSIITVR